MKKKKIIGVLLILSLLTITLGCGSTPKQSSTPAQNTQSTSTPESRPVVFSSTEDHIKYIWNNYTPRNSFKKINYEYNKDASDGAEIFYRLRDECATIEYGKDGMYLNTCKLTEITFKEIPEVEIVTVLVYADLVDAQGNEKEYPVYGAWISREDASKINWDNVGTKITHEKIVTYNYEYWMHKAYN